MDIYEKLLDELNKRNPPKERKSEQSSISNVDNFRTSSKRKAYNASENTNAIKSNALPTRKGYTPSESTKNNTANLPIAEEFKKQLEISKRVQPEENYSLPTFRKKVSENLLPTLRNEAINRGTWIAKKTGTGIAQGTAGIGQSITTEVANNFKKGNEKSGNDLLKKVADSMTLNPIQDAGDMLQTLSNSIDPTKSLWENVASFGTNLVSGTMNQLPIKKQFDTLNQVAGKILPSNASDTVMSMNNAMTKPIEESNQKLAEEGQQYGAITQTLGNTGQVVGNMVPAIVASAVTKNPIIAPQVSLGLMGISAKGQATQEALNKGATLDQAIKIGDTKAMIEVGTEMLTGGLNIFGKGALDNIVSRGINKKVKNEVLNFLTKKGIDIGGEIVEEAISDVLGTVVDKGTVDPNAEYTWEDFGDTAITTMLSTIVLNAIGGGYTPKAYKENIQNMKEYRQNQVNNQNTNQIQQTIQEENKTAQNGNMEQVQPIENNQETLYNRDESESGINGEIQRFQRLSGQFDTRLQQKNQSQQTKKYTRQEYEQWEQSIKPINENNITSEQKTIRDNIKSQYGKDIVFFDGSNSQYRGGASLTNPNSIYVDTTSVNEFGTNKIALHEVFESDIRHNKKLKEDIINPTIDSIIQDSNFQEQKNRFWEGQEDEMPSDYAIAKDILCDRFAELKSGESLDYNNVLSQETNMTIDFAIDNFEKQLNSNTLPLVVKNEAIGTLPIDESTNKTSYNVPVNEEHRTTNEIANDNSISDLEAIREASKQVETPSLQIIAQTENQLKNEKIEKSPTIDYIKQKRTKEKASLTEIKDMLAQKFVNKGHYIDKLAKQTGNSKLTWLYDRTMNTFNEAQISIGDQQVNSKGEAVGQSIIDIFEQAQRANLSIEFDDYLLNKHNISRFAHEKGIYGSEISATDSQQIVSNYEAKYPQFKEWAENVSKYNDNNLIDLVDNGLVSEETYKKLKDMYGDYVPTYRDITENISQYIEDNSVGSNPLGKAKQSNLDILSISESMAEQTLAIKKAIRMNNLGVELYKTLNPSNRDIVLNGINFDATAIEVIGGDVIQKATDGTNTFTIFQNGEMTTFKISDELYTAFEKDTLQNKINNSKVAKAILNPMEQLSKAQRELLTTYSVGFAFNNPIKDFQDALVNTKYSDVKFLKNYVKALYNIGTEGSWYESYKNNGGTANTYFDYDNGILPISSKNPIKKFANAIKSVNEVLEQAPRLAEYISTIETGGSIDEALYNSAEVTTNFKRGGDITKVANKYGANFLNASVQGLDKFYRNLTGQNGWKGYARLLVNATISSVAPAVLNSLLLGDDEDYEDLSEYVKDNYFLFKIGDGKFFRIPKGRVSSIIGGIARRVTETIQGQEVDWSSLVDTTVNNMAPNNPFTDNLIAPIKQAVDNEAWYGGEIVGSRLQSLPVAEQYDESTDEFSKWLGEKLNISPKKINYVLDQYSGGIGDVLLPMMTPQAENNILEDKFTTDSIMKNKNVSEYYSKVEELEQKKNSSNATDEDILKYKYFTDSSSDISDLYAQKREIQNSSLSDEEKKEQVREIQKQINLLVEDKLDTVDNISINGNIAKVENEEYYKKTNLKTQEAEWIKLSDEEKRQNKDISLKTYANYKEKLAQETIKQRKEGTIKEDESIKDKDKINILLNSKYSDKDMQSIYENYILNSTDKTYSAIKASEIDIKEYLKYKVQDFESDKKDDGTVNGKPVSGSKQKKVETYLNSMHITGNQRLLLYAMQGYSTTSSQKNQLAQYVYELPINKEDKLELYDKFSGFTVYKNGTIKW